DINDLGTGTAIAGTDYTTLPANATITISNGSNSGTINIPTTVDGIFEGNETINGQIANLTGAPAGVTIGTANATGIIDDADDSGITVDLSANTAVEG
ncbi:Calx-beta domain-containing protein, partial [Croceitalea sp. P059]|uniref:Calx-beta domain-containing protein n=1 Tax=Croceitalea sp. P059 TaxID=3075601 RepID=UPI00288535EA